MALLRLPNELLTLISNHLEIKDISRTCRSCRTLYHALDHILYRLIVNKSEVLFHAVEQGLAPVVEKLLIAGASPDQAMFTYPLYGAVESNSTLQDYQLQLTLLEQQNRGIQRNGPRSSQDGLSGQPPSQFWTPLHLAAGLPQRKRRPATARPRGVLTSRHCARTGWREVASVGGRKRASHRARWRRAKRFADGRRRNVSCEESHISHFRVRDAIETVV